MWRKRRRPECHLDALSEPPRVQQVTCQGDGERGRSRQVEEDGRVVRGRNRSVKDRGLVAECPAAHGEYSRYAASGKTELWKCSGEHVGQAGAIVGCAGEPQRRWGV